MDRRIEELVNDVLVNLGGKSYVLNKKVTEKYL